MNKSNRSFSFNSGTKVEVIFGEENCVWVVLRSHGNMIMGWGESLQEAVTGARINFKKLAVYALKGI